MARRIHLITGDFTPVVERIVRDLPRELATSPILVFHDWTLSPTDSVPSVSIATHGFRATLEQEQHDGTIHPLVFISRVTLDNKRNWIPMELEAGCVIWAIRPRRCVFSVHFLVYTDINVSSRSPKSVNPRSAYSVVWNFCRHTTTLEAETTLTWIFSPSSPGST